MSLTVVGLGPGSGALLTVEARGLLAARTPVLLRTRHHPAVAELDPGGTWPSCDDLYAGQRDFAAVYEAVTSRVVARAAEGDLIFAVPGNPLVEERAVALVLEAARRAGISCRIVPGLSFADLATAALGRDLGQVQLCDALDLRIDAWRPALISQVFDRDTATGVKLALLEVYPEDHAVDVLHALGTPAEAVQTLPLHALDHRPYGYLDTVYVPPLEPLMDIRRFDGLWHVVRRLHQPEGGCPWDLEQTHASLRKYLLEESYEVLEAIDEGADPARLAEELGDLLLQVLMHTALAERTGEFTLGDVTATLARKLIHRHPHVFGEGTARTAEDVRQSWEQLKQQEKARSSVLEGVPTALPALAASQTLQGRARRVGFDWPDIEGPLEKLVEEVREFALAADASEREDEFGDILFVLANIAQRVGVDAEQALRRANAKFRQRFTIVERLAAEAERPLAGMTLAELDALWDRAKEELAAREPTPPQ